MRKNTFLVLKFLWPYFIIIFPLIFFYINYNYSPRADWLYFNSLAHFSWPITNGGISFSDLNICGGVDNFANPQMWYFSPVNVLYFFFGAYWGNILSWYLFCCIGFFYLNLICRDFGYKEFIVKSISLIFVISSFFSLHFIEGHIVFRTFFLIPAVYYYVYTNLDARKLSFIVMILSLMILDGGMYPFFFSLLMIPFVFNFTTFKKSILLNRLFFFICFACALICLAKVLPVLSLHSKRIMQNDPETYSLFSFIKAIYYPFFTNWDVLYGMKYRAHEYALYVGLGITLLVIGNIKALVRQKEFLIAFIFLWLATGLGGDVNPWLLIKKVPYLQQIHVQSRFLILFFFFILIALIKTKRLGTKTNLIFMMIALVEGFLVYSYVISQSFVRKEPLHSYNFLQKKIGLSYYDEYVEKPNVYGKNRISFKCYEPAIQKNIIPSRNIFINTTQGLEPSLTIENNVLTVLLKKELERPLVINLNWNAGWSCENCEIEYNDGIIQINTLGKKEYKITYTPFYFPFIFISWIIGVAVGFYGWKKYKKL